MIEMKTILTKGKRLQNILRQDPKAIWWTRSFKKLSQGEEQKESKRCFKENYYPTGCSLLHYERRVWSVSLGKEYNQLEPIFQESLKELYVTVVGMDAVGSIPARALSE